MFFERLDFVLFKVFNYHPDEINRNADDECRANQNRRIMLKLGNMRSNTGK